MLDVVLRVEVRDTRVPVGAGNRTVDQMPDPGFYRECLDASFEELKLAVLGKTRAPVKVKRKAVVKKKPATKPGLKKAAPRKAPVKNKAAGNRAATKNTGAKKSAAKPAVAKKSVAKKAVSAKTATVTVSAGDKVIH